MLLLEGRCRTSLLPSQPEPVYPFVHLGREGQDKVGLKCFAQGHNTRAYTGLELTALGSWGQSSTSYASLFTTNIFFFRTSTTKHVRYALLLWWDILSCLDHYLKCKILHTSGRSAKTIARINYASKPTRERLFEPRRIFIIQNSCSHSNRPRKLGLHLML